MAVVLAIAKSYAHDDLGVEGDDMTDVGRVIAGALLGLFVLGISSCGEDATKQGRPAVEAPPPSGYRPAIEVEQCANAVASGYGIKTNCFRVTLSEACWVKARLDLWKRGAEEAVVLSETQTSVQPGGLLTFALPPGQLTSARKLLHMADKAAWAEMMGPQHAYLAVDDPDGTSRGERLVFSEPVYVGMADLDEPVNLRSRGSSGSQAHGGPIKMHTDIPVYGMAWGRETGCSIVWYADTQGGPDVEMTFQQGPCDCVLVLVLRFWPMDDDPDQTETGD
ncbi:MAG: hypothetical protein ACYTG6_08490 [Planctomycetota bacterium]